MTRKTYSDEFKREAVRLANANGPTRTARDLGIHVTMIARWRQQLEASPQRPFPGNGNPRDEEMARLRRELTRVKEENAILKKAVGVDHR